MAMGLGLVYIIANFAGFPTTKACFGAMAALVICDMAFCNCRARMAQRRVQYGAQLAMMTARDAADDSRLLIVSIFSGLISGLWLFKAVLIMVVGHI